MMSGSSSAVGPELAAASDSGPKERRRVERFFFVGFGRVRAEEDLLVESKVNGGEIVSTYRIAQMYPLIYPRRYPLRLHLPRFYGLLVGATRMKNACWNRELGGES